MQYDTYNNALTVLIGDTYVKSILHQNVIYNMVKVQYFKHSSNIRISSRYDYKYTQKKTISALRKKDIVSSRYYYKCTKNYNRSIRVVIN